MRRCFVIAAVFLLFVASVVADSKGKALLFEYVGQVTNSGQNSAQFGNLTGVAGARSSLHFTFYTSASNSSVITNGPMKIIDRTGTTTIYLSPKPGDFANPDSFRAGAPLQVSSMQQQVIVNTATGSFTVVNTNTVSSAKDVGKELGDVGSSFRTYLSGQLNTAGASPSGWFGGYAVAVR